MSDAILTKEQLSEYIDKVISSLQSGDSVLLSELASLLQTLAIVADDQILLALPQSIGSFASEFARFKTLVSVPFLDAEQRKRCNGSVEKAESDVVEGLKILQKELCNSSQRNCQNILNAMSMFSKHGYLLYSIRNQYTAVPSQRLMQDE